MKTSQVRQLIEQMPDAPIAVAVAVTVQMKAEADENVGGLMQRLNECGPRGNRSVEAQLDGWQGRSAAYSDVLTMLTTLAASLASR